MKATVQPSIGILHNRTFMGMLGSKPSTQMYGLGRSFQYGENNSMVTEALEEYELDSS